MPDEPRVFVRATFSHEARTDAGRLHRLALSHRNTNVRSLALSLSQKPALTAACADRLHALNDALGKRGYKVARWK